MKRDPEAEGSDVSDCALLCCAKQKPDCCILQQPGFLFDQLVQTNAVSI